MRIGSYKLYLGYTVILPWMVRTFIKDVILFAQAKILTQKYQNLKKEELKWLFPTKICQKDKDLNLTKMGGKLSSWSQGGVKSAEHTYTGPYREYP